MDAARHEKKVFYSTIPGNARPEDVPVLFPASSLAPLREAGIATALLVSSEPVDGPLYLAVIRTLRDQGLRVINAYLESLDRGTMTTVNHAVVELQAAMAQGGFLIISYRHSHASALLAAYFIQVGMGVSEAMNRARTVDPGADLTASHAFLLAYERAMTPAAVTEAAAITAVPASAPPLTAAAPAKPAPSPIAAPVQAAALQAAAIVVDLTDSAATAPKTTPKKPADKPAPAAANKPAPASSVKPVKTPTAAPAKAAGKKNEKKPTPAAASPGKPPVFASIRFKLIGMISVLIAVSLSGMIFLATYFFKTDNEIRARENNKNIAEVTALKIRSEMEKYQLMASTLVTTQGTAVPGSDDIIYAGLVKQQGRDKTPGNVREFFNQETMGRLSLSRADIASIHGKLEDQRTRAMAGETIIVNISPYLEQPAMAMLYPAGDPQSIMVCYLRLASIQKTFQTAGIIKTFFINSAGDILAHPDGALVTSSANAAKNPICAMMMRSKIDNGQTRYSDEAGVGFIGSFQKTGIGGTGVIATVEERTAFQEVYNIQRRNLYLMGIVIAVAILIVYFFGKTMTTPIIRLVEATKQIIQGQYRVDIRASSRDEVGQLTNTFIEMGHGLEEREKIKSAFGKFVNKEVAEAALRDELRLGGERKTIAILFSDIRSFTSISESLNPEEVVGFLNQYLTRMVACVEKTGGLVDKFIGDAIMAVWGTPVSRGNDTANAVNGALLMRRELIEFNKGRGGPRTPLIQIGCGINTGDALAGQIGSENRMEYTVIGDAVNLASRIESLNKAFATDILISEESYALVRDLIAVEPMKKIRVKGKSEAQQIYAVLGRVDDPDRPKTVEELRLLIGITDAPPAAGPEVLDIGEEEKKYEIIEK